MTEFTKFELKGVKELANHKSALKRAKQNLVRRERNKNSRTRIKGIVKEVQALAGGNSAEGAEKLIVAQSIIDKGAKKGVIHRKTAARKISRLTKLINSAAA